MRTVNPVVHRRQMERITRTALRHFAARGYDRTSMDEIARACGIRKASLYHYYRGKKELLHDLIRSRLKKGHPREGFPPAGSLWDKEQKGFP